MKHFHRERKVVRDRQAMLLLALRYSEKDVRDALLDARRKMENHILTAHKVDAAFVLGYKRALNRFRRSLNAMTAREPEPDYD